MDKIKLLIHTFFLKIRQFKLNLDFFAYYIGKIVIFNISGTPVLIGYTKKHPIFTSIFEDDPPDGLLFYYFEPGSSAGFLVKYLNRNTSVLHLDGASASRVKRNGKKKIIEFEGETFHTYLDDKTIDRLFVESEWAGGRYLKDERITLVYPAIPVAKIRDKIRKSNNKPITLCAVGHGGMIKGFDVVVRLYSELKKDYNIKLIIAGSFGHNFNYYPEISEESYKRSNFSALEEILKDDKDAIFRSFKRRELFKYVYPQADIYIHLSRLETFGYSILEAMSHGLPIVACKLHAIPEMVENGYNGFLVDAFNYDINSEEWYENTFDQSKKAVISLIEDPLLTDQFGKNSIKRVLEKFNVERKKQFLKDCYKNL